MSNHNFTSESHRSQFLQSDSLAINSPIELERLSAEATLDLYRNSLLDSREINPYAYEENLEEILEKEKIPVLTYRAEPLAMATILLNSLIGYESAGLYQS